jgi:hypothetical protein
MIPMSAHDDSEHGPNDGCVVLVPVAQYIEPATEMALQVLEERGYEVWRVYGHSDIARGRSKIATEALAEGFEELMWIDADVVFDPDAVDRLRAAQLPICAGIYPCKGRRRIASAVAAGTRRIRFGVGGGLLELRYSATGFLHTRRVVYEAMVEQLRLPVCTESDGSELVPYFLSLVVEDEGGFSYLSEDFSFCHRARQCGFAIMADTQIRLGHVGRYVFSWEDAGQELSRVATFDLELPGSEPERPADPPSVDFSAAG